MFTGFNVEIERERNYSDYIDRGKEIFAEQRKDIINQLNYYTDSEGIIDGEQLQKNWFPDIKADIFLSHSHKDEPIALGLAGWLHKEMGLTAFIDSQVWGYAGDLLREIDKKYCKIEGSDNYDYNKRNFSTSHVHIMLSTALTKMMDNTECLFFLNTSNSISNAKEVIKHETESSWIYHEIAMMDLIRKKSPEEHREGREGLQKSAEKRSEESDQLRIKYSLNLNDLPRLKDFTLLIVAFKAKVNNEHGLDALYKYSNIETS
ncbi:hypothetical protein ATL39_2786 [Sinobaca qinghaiensis]|uniref:TIR domain-containing protein n=1 Tax=Sinobaca qinghaiensis TaxID=342944 RepID=A0A419V0G3_9BACL|nr:toll/interleukin-1 receptor domain-containing protein [Sinobaca qinghaiensis]RKD71389.1 hypothetical protein ATL39_2786 [Sinobaca qinghaiensis]